MYKRPEEIVKATGGRKLRYNQLHIVAGTLPTG